MVKDYWTMIPIIHFLIFDDFSRNMRKSWMTIEKKRKYEKIVQSSNLVLVEYLQYMLLLRNYKGLLVLNNTLSDLRVFGEVCRSHHFVLSFIIELRKIWTSIYLCMCRAEVTLFAEVITSTKILPKLQLRQTMLSKL